MNQDAPDLSNPDSMMAAVGAVSLRLLAGTVSRKTMEQLQRTVQQSPSEYPWQVVTQAILAEPVDEQKLVQQGLRAQRDWLLRGGRETPGKPVSVQAKTFVARLLVQTITVAIVAVLLVVALLILKHKFPAFDIYAVLTWVQQTFPNLLPK